MTKKACIFYGGYLHKAGGAFNHARMLQSEMLKKNWDVSIITLDKLPIWFRFLPHIVERLANTFSMPLGFYYKGLCTKFLYKLYFEKKFELNIFEDIYLSWNSSKKSITLLHAVWSDNLQAFSLSEKQIQNLKSKELSLIENIKHPVATVSTQYAKYIQEQHFDRRLKKKLHTIPLGVNQNSHIFPKGNLKAKKSIVYSGTLEARKNVDFLLKVFKEIYAQDSYYKLTLIGDGPLRHKLQNYARQNNLPVYFLGRISYDQIIHELSKHSLCIHPSTKESFSFSLLEAKLSGLKTFAYSGLQVPAEFIDVGFSNFDVQSWCDGVLNSDQNALSVDLSQYTAENMTAQTIKLANSY